jgi:predicted SAM-dependent methyltransferase
MIQGYVDQCDADSIMGWAYDIHIGSAPELSVFVNDVMVATIQPNQSREDLQGLDIHRPAGFCCEFKTALNYGDVVCVKTNSGEDLNGSPLVYGREYISSVFNGKRDLRKDLSCTFLRGCGIEIGALNKPLPVSPTATVCYIDRMMSAALFEQYPEIDETTVVTPDILDDGETLGSLKDDSQDFVIANHFLEHAENPILCIRNFVRVLKEGGIIYLALPDKEKTFDRNRKETTIKHLLKDYRSGGKRSRKKHYRQWAEHVNGMKGREIKQRAKALEREKYSIHFHVWTFESALHFIGFLSAVQRIPFRVLIALRNPPNEMIFILKKR